MTFLDPQTPAMRDYSFKSDRILGGDGTNLSGILYSLCSDPETKEALLQFIKALREQDIKDITFIETPRAEVMVRLTETFGSVEPPCDAPLLSDGTLRVLAIAAAMLSAPSESLVVIEEVDNGIHPSRAGQLLDHICCTSPASAVFGCSSAAITPPCWMPCQGRCPMWPSVTAWKTAPALWFASWTWRRTIQAWWPKALSVT